MKHLILAVLLLTLASPVYAEDNKIVAHTPPEVKAEATVPAPEEAKVAAPIPDEPVKNLDATDAAAIADVAAVSAILTDITAKVMECTKGEETPALCQCKNTTELGNLQTAVDTALKNHPDWADAMVSYRDPAKNDSASVSFPGVRKQLSVCK